MRCPLKTVVQVILFFVLMIFLNVYISLVYHNKQVSVSELRRDSEVGASDVQPSNGNSAKSNADVVPHDETVVNDRSAHDAIRNVHIEKSSQVDIVERRKSISISNKEADSSLVFNNNHHNATVTHQSLENVSDVITNQPRTTELRDIFISVKTTQKFHRERLDLQLDTWVKLAQDETYFFTDSEDNEYSKKTRDHLINTNCSSVHNRVALCCKMSVEYDYYIASNKRWFCHVDDDTYVNIPELSRLLQKYDHMEDWYLGKPSLTHPIEINDPESPGQKYAFWFATGGAGFCLSRGLALKMMPWTAGGKLKTTCSMIRLPDDCTIAFVIYYYLHKELTVVQEFHSHLEGLWRLKSADLDKQISYSYQRIPNKKPNIVSIPGYSDADDPSRFRSIHCRLFPYLEGCPNGPPR